MNATQVDITKYQSPIRGKVVKRMRKYFGDDLSHMYQSPIRCKVEQHFVFSKIISSTFCIVKFVVLQKCS